MYKRKFKHYKHLYKFGCILLATIVLVCTLALPTFAMTIKPIDEGSAGGSIQVIRTNIKFNFYIDNIYERYMQTSYTTSQMYVYLCFDNVTDIDTNDTHMGNLAGIFFTSNAGFNPGNYNVTSQTFWYFGDNYVGGLLIESSILQGVTGVNRGYYGFTVDGVDYGQFLCFAFEVPTSARYQNECNLMLYSSEVNIDNVYNNDIMLKLGTYASVPYMRMPYQWYQVNQLEYEELFTPNLYLMEYLKGRFDITGNLAFYCYIDGNGYKFDDIADLFTYGTYPFTIQYSIDGSIGYDPPDYPYPPDDPPPADPPDSSTSSTTPIIPTIDPNEPISTLPTGNIPDVDEDTKNTIVLIIDHMWSGFYTTFSTLLSQTGIFGMSLLSIFAILILLIVGAFLIKLWRGN